MHASGRAHPYYLPLSGFSRYFVDFSVIIPTVLFASDGAFPSVLQSRNGLKESLDSLL